MKTARRMCLGAVVVTVCAVAFLLGRKPAELTEEASATKVKAPMVQAVPTVAKAQTAVQALAELPTNQTATVRGTKPFVLTCSVPIQKSLRLAAESLGARTVCSLSRNSLMVEADPATRARLVADGRFSAADEFLPSAKIDPDLMKQIAGGAKSVEIVIVTLAAEDRLPMIERVKALGGEILTGCLNDGDNFRASISAEQVAGLAVRGDVRWMEPFVRPHIANDLAVTPTAMNVQAVREVLPEGLNGEGQFVSTSDSGVDLNHPDLKNQVVGHKVATEDCFDVDDSGHGTHTAGSILGDGTQSMDREEGPIRGTAYGAKLWAWFCGGKDGYIYTPSSKDDLFQPDQEKAPAYIHSASWGSDLGGKYETECASTDLFVWKHPDFLPVYSAGNSGEEGAMTIGSPAAAKNVLTVGATENVRTGTFGGHGPYPLIPSGDPTLTASYSSRGPCQDGRIKPDVAAPGSGVLSTRSHDVDYGYGIYEDHDGAYAEWYAFDCGTSMACPLTAGAVAVVRQWLTSSELGGFEDAEGARPTAALMKAVITGGAKDAAVPNHDQGWGRVDVKETLFPTDRAVKLVDRIPFAENEEFAWIVETTNAAPLDVQLCWVDYPGSGAQNEAKLVNDLDLTVRPLDDPDGEILYGNGGESEDRLNNLESVRIASAAPKRYLVSVNCETILHDCTEGGAAALYIRGAFDPDMVSTNYGRVCIRETGKLYMSLDKALAAAGDGETVEILEPVRLRATVAVSNAVTIVATNDVASASPVTPVGGARIELADGANVLFTNVVFSSSGMLTVDAQAGGVIRVAGCADLGEIRLATKENLCVAGYLTMPILVDAPFAKGNGEVFGALERAEFGETANYLLNKYDEESGGEGVGTAVRWLQGASVPDAAAVARVEPVEEAYTNYRSMAVLFKYNRSGLVTVLKSTIFTNYLDGLVAAMSIRGATDDIVVSPADDAGFVVTAGGSLTFSNLTFSSRSGKTAFVTVDGGEFTLEDGACLHRLDGTAGTGAVEIDSGTVTMRPGSEIRDCANLSPLNGGGAIWMAGERCTLNLEGGSITQCSAETYGGAVYAVYRGAVVNLGGPLTVYGNISSGGSYELVDDDLYFPEETDLTLTDNLTGGYVGLTYDYYGFPEAGEPFIGVAEGLQGEVTDRTLACFVCELLDADDGEAYEAEVSEDGESLVWKAVPAGVSRTEPDPDYDVARIVRGSVTNYYYFIDGDNGAFESAQDDDVIELLQSADFTSDIAVECAVTLRPVAEGIKIFRTANCGFVVEPGGDLILDGVAIDGISGQRGKNASLTLFWVEGGSLTLTNGTVISAVSGNYNRAAGAVAVSDDGTFTMTEGTEIRNCVNGYGNEQDGTAVGAALLVDKGTAYLRGGTITGNSAYRAAGVFVGNDGVAYVSGDLFVKNNTKTSGDVARSDFVVEERGQLYLDGDLTGMSSIGIEEGIPGALLNTNVFGRVSEDALKACGGISGAANYATSAAKFFRDDNPMVVGRVVTNETKKALLVWATAIEGGVYVDKDGTVYGAVSATRVEVPTAVPGLAYDGNAKIGVVETAEGYSLEGNVATNAGTYKAMAYLKPGYLWADGSATPKEVSWSIAKAVYDMSGITFEDATFTYDGQPKSIFISGDLPAGVTTNYIGNGVVEVYPWYEVRVKFYGDETNYEKIPDKVAHITIENGDDPDPDPQWEVVTNQPTPIAFKSIDRVGDTEWSLVITDRVEFCNYRLLWTDDLTKGFTSTGDWEQAHADGPWTTNVITTGGIWFWRAEGTEGTNMVPPVVEN